MNDNKFHFGIYCTDKVGNISYLSLRFLWNSNHLKRNIKCWFIISNEIDKKLIFIFFISREDKIRKILLHSANSSIMDFAADTWNAITPSPVGMISVGGKMNPETRVSLNSMKYAYGMSASPTAESAEPPEAVYNRYGICPT